uniref:Retrovirus-related Pol polyprotein from transposon TNT 1-94 n=1 Tax=Tanacetum cinerariifolium TaxID=118510 RepID=A0A6L2JC61_TANCI|nr:hypothetical protein [Tanacetum cinerariifolium]
MNQTQRAINSIKNDSLDALYGKYHYDEDLNAEYHERALLTNQKRFYKRPESVGSTRKLMNKSKETCFVVENLRINELTKGKNDKGKGNKGKSDKGLTTELFDWDDESVSSKDEGTTKFKALMAIAEDEPLFRKGDARSGQWVDITMKKRRSKENNLKEVLFTKANVSISKSAPMITSDSEDDSDNQVDSVKLLSPDDEASE